MGLAPQKFREIVFLVLYTNDFHKNDSDELISIVMKELQVSKKNVQQALDKVNALLQNQSIIDSAIREVSTSYDFERIHSIERNVLRLAVFELVVEKRIPPKVAIAEAKRLAKKFSTQEAPSFVHALLEAICHKHGILLS